MPPVDPHHPDRRHRHPLPPPTPPTAPPAASDCIRPPFARYPGPWATTPTSSPAPRPPTTRRPCSTPTCSPTATRSPRRATSSRAAPSAKRRGPGPRLPRRQRPPLLLPERAAALGKIVVMVEANIHAGEVEGKEMILALVRKLVRDELGKAGRKILRDVCLVVVPNLNPDGNDRISPRHRALDLKNLEGQVNPGGVGTRYTGEGWNLNRDGTKHEAIETRSLAALYQTWWPHLFIDCHTTDGSLHAFDLTFDTSRNNDALFPALRRDNRRLLADVSRRVRRRHGVTSFWYGNYAVEDDPTSGWHTYPALPRFGSHYRGLLGRFDVLLETYSYLTFRRRCGSSTPGSSSSSATPPSTPTTSAPVAPKRKSASSPAAPPAIPASASASSTASPSAPDGALTFDYPAYAVDDDQAVIEAFDRESLRARVYPGAQRATYRVPHYRTFVPVIEVTTPAAYLAPPELADRLRGHGIAFELLTEDSTFDVESYRVVAKGRPSPRRRRPRPTPGQAEVPLSAKPPPTRFETVLTVSPARHRFTAPAGTLWVPTTQRAGTLAVLLLEPHSEDGFARWQLLDSMIEVGRDYPVRRVLESSGAAPKKGSRVERRRVDVILFRYHFTCDVSAAILNPWRR
ncbi:MAG: M14 family zinc carboxypeptidase [Kofleriaceae bacterium]